MIYIQKYHIIEKMQYDNFGTFIREKRLANNISLNCFALQNDIEPAILSRIENQKQDIKLGILTKIANGFSISLSDLIKEYELKQ